MRALFLWFGRLITLLFVAGAIMLGAVLGLSLKSLPSYNATHTVPHITTPVEVVRDTDAVPHIHAETDLDVFFGLGFVHAQDRLWQMNMSRRLAQGRLSEIIGSRTLERDILMRTLNLEGYAKATFARQSAETQAVLQAYANGVNSWIAHAGHRYYGASPEFLLARTTMEPWRAYDSILIQKSMAFSIATGARQEIERARFAARLAPKDLEDLFPSDVNTHSDLWQRYAETFPARDIMLGAASHEWSEPYTSQGASNVWAVDARRTAYGASLLASDPHLGLQSPSIWYMAHLRLANGLTPIGATIPGVPVVSIGHNTHVSWGIAASHIDDQDIYFQKLNPKNAAEYATKDGFTPFQTRKITISVKDAQDVTHTVRWTRHGPVLPDSYLGLSDILPSGHVATLQWSAFTDQDTTLSASLDLMRAQTLETAIKSTHDIATPSLNIVLASQEDVAMVVTGRVPQRTRRHTTQGRLPAEGWRPENSWQGFIAARDLPQTINPRSGIVANANNRTTRAAYPKHLSFDWAAPYRIKRIDKLLTTREFHTLNSFTAMQNDTISEAARTLLPLIGTSIWWDSADMDQVKNSILTRLKAWNGDMNEHQVEPLIFMTWMRTLTRLIVQDELGELQKNYAGMRPLFLERVFTNTDGAERWCDVMQTQQQESCAEIADVALEQTIKSLTERYGANINFWRWGKAHVAIHRHLPFGHTPILEWFFNIEQETSGGDETILRGLTSQLNNTSHENIQSSAYKMVVDFNDLERSVFIVSTGQSGHPLSRHYDDLAEKWRIGQYIPMRIENDDTRAGSVGTMRLVPEE